MRQTALAAVLLAALSAAPSAAAPDAAGRSLGKPIRVMLRAPAAGNASMALVEFRLVAKGKRSAAALPRIAVLVRAAGRKRKDVFVVRGVKRTGDTVRVGGTFVLPHVFESKGDITNPRMTFDTQFFATYSAGLASPPPGSVGLDIFVFDAASGQPLVNADGSACGTCPFQIGPDRKKAVLVENLISDGQPAVPPGVLLGYGVLTVGAGSADTANLFSFVTNAHTSAFDLSVFGFTPQEVTAPGDGQAAGTVFGAAVDHAANRQTRRARLLRNATRRLLGSPVDPPPPPLPPGPVPFSLFLDFNHNHGPGTTNLCTQVRTSPALAGAPGNARLAGPSGAGTRPFTTGPDGRAVVVFPIDRYGTYTMDVTVREKTARETYTVTAAAGSNAFACPAP